MELMEIKGQERSSTDEIFDLSLLFKLNLILSNNN
jgi:hypothetical protein